jgi:hypothetical protein
MQIIFVIELDIQNPEVFNTVALNFAILQRCSRTGSELTDIVQYIYK